MGETKTRYRPPTNKRAWRDGGQQKHVTHPTNLSFVSKKTSRVIMDFESGWWATAHPTNERRGWWATKTRYPPYKSEFCFKKNLTGYHGF
ncbi:MAG: hypothetical protein DRR00_31285 [Candidatus Parabeggiatoa sp. nov. 3]|nr:MAG: hypothetical protein DRR00_31285 [Gammaproteobacteria bacterium]